MKWINVDTDTPKNKEGERSKEVIALADNGQVFKLAFMSGYWQRSSLFVNSGAKKINYWMPFPDF